MQLLNFGALLRSPEVRRLVLPTLLWSNDKSTELPTCWWRSSRCYGDTRRYIDGWERLKTWNTIPGETLSSTFRF